MQFPREINMKLYNQPQPDLGTRGEHSHSRGNRAMPQLRPTTNIAGFTRRTNGYPPSQGGSIRVGYQNHQIHRREHRNRLAPYPCILFIRPTFRLEPNSCPGEATYTRADQAGLGRVAQNRPSEQYHQYPYNQISWDTNWSTPPVTAFSATTAPTNNQQGFLSSYNPPFSLDPPGSFGSALPNVESLAATPSVPYQTSSEAWDGIFNANSTNHIEPYSEVVSEPGPGPGPTTQHSLFPSSLNLEQLPMSGDEVPTLTHIDPALLMLKTNNLLPGSGHRRDPKVENNVAPLPKRPFSPASSWGASGLDSDRGHDVHNHDREGALALLSLARPRRSQSQAESKTTTIDEPPLLVLPSPIRPVEAGLNDDSNDGTNEDSDEDSDEDSNEGSDEGSDEERALGSAESSCDGSCTTTTSPGGAETSSSSSKIPGFHRPGPAVNHAGVVCPRPRKPLCDLEVLSRSCYF